MITKRDFILRSSYFCEQYVASSAIRKCSNILQTTTIMKLSKQAYESDRKVERDILREVTGFRERYVRVHRTYTIKWSFLRGWL